MSYDESLGVSLTIPIRWKPLYCSSASTAHIMTARTWLPAGTHSKNTPYQATDSCSARFADVSYRDLPMNRFCTHLTYYRCMIHREYSGDKDRLDREGTGKLSWSKGGMRLIPCARYGLITSIPGRLKVALVLPRGILRARRVVQSYAE